MDKLIIDQLKNIVESKLISFHMPGHKLGKIYDKLGYKSTLENLYKMDTTEIPGTDNLHSPEGAIKSSQIIAAEVFEAENTYFLVNGSTCGIEAAIMTVCNPTDKIIVNRDCHQSVINACILGDINPEYIKPKINDKNNVLEGVVVEDAIKAIDLNKDAKAILLTYPTYYGMTYDLEKICKYAHDNNMIVIVDEAHGAHLGLSNRLPKTAMKQGADIVIQSTHKTLPAFTQSSMIHTQGNRVNNNRLANMLRMTESSSPSYMLLSSLEIATDIYKKHGRNMMELLIDKIDSLKKELEKNKAIDIYETNDSTKVIISCISIGLTGYDLADILREKYNIQVELSNYYGVLLICTIGNDEKDFECLKKSLDDISKKYSRDLNIEDIEYPKEIPKKAISPREAFYKDKKSVKIDESIDKICAEYVIPYPPGISLLSPGEIITKDVIDYIKLCSKKGMDINGMKDTSLEFIQIID